MNTKQFEALCARDEMLKLLLKACDDFIDKRIRMKEFKDVISQIGQATGYGKKRAVRRLS